MPRAMAGPTQGGVSSAMELGQRHRANNAAMTRRARRRRPPVRSGRSHRAGHRSHGPRSNGRTSSLHSRNRNDGNGRQRRMGTSRKRGKCLSRSPLKACGCPNA